MPIIWKKGANASKHPLKVNPHKAGGLYIGQTSATSVLVPSAEEMRDLMNRACVKRGDQLLGTIKNLLSGNPAPTSQELAKYDNNLKTAQQYFKEALPPKFEKKGYWQLIAFPETYSRERSHLTTVMKFILEAEVNLRGWNFHTPTRTQSRTSATADNRSSTIFSALGTPYIEAYRAYQSGFFIWRGAYREDAAEFVTKYGKRLSAL